MALLAHLKAGFKKMVPTRETLTNEKTDGTPNLIK
jgi:hypothetical protein